MAINRLTAARVRLRVDRTIWWRLQTAAIDVALDQGDGSGHLLQAPYKDVRLEVRRSQGASLLRHDKPDAVSVAGWYSQPTHPS